MLNLTALTWIRFLIWMAIGVVVYFAYGRRHSVLAGREAAEMSLALQNVALCLDIGQTWLYSQVTDVMALTGGGVS
jgi:hypothetical protein